MAFYIQSQYLLHDISDLYLKVYVFILKYPYEILIIVIVLVLLNRLRLLPTLCNAFESLKPATELSLISASDPLCAFLLSLIG